MDIRRKINAEFCIEVNETLARYESKYDQVSSRVEQVFNTLQQVLSELQAMRISQNPQPFPTETN